MLDHGRTTDCLQFAALPLTLLLCGRSGGVSRGATQSHVRKYRSILDLVSKKAGSKAALKVVPKMPTVVPQVLDVTKQQLLGNPSNCGQQPTLWESNWLTVPLGYIWIWWVFGYDIFCPISHVFQSPFPDMDAGRKMRYQIYQIYQIWKWIYKI